MKSFIARFGEQVTAVLSGFDRLVFRGTLQPLFYTHGMFHFLQRAGVMLLDFKSSTYPLHIFGLTVPCYAAVSALLANLAVSWALTVVLRAATSTPQIDETVAADYV